MVPGQIPTLVLCARLLPTRTNQETAVVRHACLLGQEGMDFKHRESTYRAGRSQHWINVKNRQHPAVARVQDQFG